MKTLDKLTVPNAAAWAQWLLENASKSPGVSLTLAKKGILEPTSLNQDEAVEEALCHGWINGQGHTIDEKTYMQRFTPRAAKSVWSKRNVGLVEKLEKEGRMQAAGRATVAAAQQDGRWQRAYSGAANLDEMQDLVDAIRASPVALEAWDSLAKGQRSQIYFRLAALKTEAGREKRIREYVKGLELGEAGVPTTSSRSAEKGRKRLSNEVSQAENSSKPNGVVVKKTRSGRAVRAPAS